MKELYIMDTQNGYKYITMPEANQKYGEMEFPYHEDKDDDLRSVLECETCDCVYEYDPQYVDCPVCNGDLRKEQTKRGLYVYREARTLPIEVGGYSVAERKKTFHILPRNVLEQRIDSLNPAEIWRKTYEKASAYAHSGYAYAYLDARNGNLATHWLDTSTMLHPWDSFYEIWLCDMKSGDSFIALDTAENLLSEDEQKKFKEFDGSIREFLEERRENYEERIENAIDWYAQEFQFNLVRIEEQLDELYLLRTKK